MTLTSARLSPPTTDGPRASRTGRRSRRNSWRRPASMRTVRLQVRLGLLALLIGIALGGRLGFRGAALVVARSYA